MGDVLLGKSDCFECGGKGTKTLIIDKRRGVFSKCKNCGFCEWEWTYGDNADYLMHLAKEYKISFQELIKALEG
jgi:hypothetical protein